MSASRPNTTINTVVANMNDNNIQLAAVALAWKCRTTSGSATFSELLPRAIRMLAKLTTDNTRHA
ncbi:hypothetical protein Psi02_38800 [Planotetraspora silvatica]|uniref:Uncharacterized protein n=1 Tax=Planotetraspora silvatica TaxID=234614 RepID=A0A8J3UN50_9ACTN|nr:hypothetical protein Psi02_38800 [Planotetraspora silvatica]